MSSRRPFVIGAALLAAGLAVPAWVTAQAAYPNRSIRFIVPYSAGGLPDTVARIYAQRLGAALGQGVVVDNKPGANGVVAAQALASAPPDGYTFLVTDGSMFSINPAIYKTLSYDFKRDFIPVSLAARAPLYLAVHPKTGVNTFQEFVTMARAKPGALNYGSSGIGSSHHLTMEAMKVALGIDVVHVPFKGTGQSVPALIGGQVDVAFSALPSVSGFVKANQIKLLATNAAKRSAQEPGVPAIAEIVPGFDFAVIVGVLASTGTPSAVVERISAEMDKVAKAPETIQILANAGIEAVGGKPGDYAKAILDENERLAKVLKTVSIKQE